MSCSRICTHPNVNSRAFELAGITRDTPDPGHGGFFERDAQGELTGKLIESPALLPFVTKFGFPQSVEVWEELIGAEYERYAEMGVTSISSMGLRKIQVEYKLISMLSY